MQRVELRSKSMVGAQNDAGHNRRARDNRTTNLKVVSIERGGGGELPFDRRIFDFS